MIALPTLSPLISEKRKKKCVGPMNAMESWYVKFDTDFSFISSFKIIQSACKKIQCFSYKFFFIFEKRLASFQEIRVIEKDQFLKD